MRLRCFYCDVRELPDPKEAPELLKRLPWQERREKTLRFLRESDRRRSLGAGLLAEEALRRFGAVDLTIEKGEQGKPFLPAHPELHFNLSHSGDFAVCAVSDQKVGIDTEEPQDYRENVARRFYTADEKRSIESSTDPDYRYVNIWVKKESYLKLLGCGLTISPETFSVLTGEGMEEPFFFSEAEIEGQQVCVCTAVKPEEFLIERVSLF